VDADGVEHSAIGFWCTYGLTTKPDYVSNHSHVVMLDRVTNWTKHTSILSDALDALKDEHVAIHGSDQV